MMHSGHYNALRQAKKFGDVLVVGVISDEEILRAKGAPPVFNLAERVNQVKQCKWVDEVIEGANYEVELSVLEELKCDFYAHGDDIALNADGLDSCQSIRDAGKYKEFQRTKGVSTTSVVGKLLMNLQLHPNAHDKVDKPVKSSVLGENLKKLSIGSEEDLKKEKIEMKKKGSKFLASSIRIMQFANRKEPQPGDTIVYIDGSFDLCHEGHIEQIQKAKELGDFLYVGVHDDQTVGNPYMTLNERVLMVLAQKSVDDVIIGAPKFLDKDMMNVFNINIVVPALETYADEAPEQYAPLQELKIMNKVEVSSDMNINLITQRIIDNSVLHLQKQKSKG